MKWQKREKKAMCWLNEAKFSCRSRGIITTKQLDKWCWVVNVCAFAIKMCMKRERKRKKRRIIIWKVRLMGWNVYCKRRYLFSFQHFILFTFRLTFVLTQRGTEAFLFFNCIRRHFGTDTSEENDKKNYDNRGKLNSFSHSFCLDWEETR